MKKLYVLQSISLLFFFFYFVEIKASIKTLPFETCIISLANIEKKAQEEKIVHSLLNKSFEHPNLSWFSEEASKSQATHLCFLSTQKEDVLEEKIKDFNETHKGFSPLEIIKLKTNQGEEILAVAWKICDILDPKRLEEQGIILYELEYGRLTSDHPDVGIRYNFFVKIPS